MCDPVSIGFAITSVISIATTVLTKNAQSHQARQNYAAADEATKNSYNDIGYRQLQERVSASQKAQETSRRGLAARSLAGVSAGESGVSGNSVNALLNDLMGQEARFNDSIAYQAEANVEQLQAAKRSEATANMSRKLQTPMPSFGAAALRIGGAIASGANGIYGQMAPTPATAGGAETLYDPAQINNYGY